MLQHARHETMAQHAVIYGAGEPIEHVLFPERCIVSLIVELPEGRDIEVAAIGSEGVVGVGGSLSGEHSYAQQRVLVGGAAHVVRREAFRTLQRRCPRLAAAVNAHRDVFSAQLLQSIACVAAHPAEQRLARWLLEMVDRSRTPDIRFTHEILALIVGVGRPTVTLLLQALEAARLIKTSRGLINVLDRNALAGVACACYRSVKEAYGKAGLVEIQAS